MKDWEHTSSEFETTLVSQLTKIKGLSYAIPSRHENRLGSGVERVDLELEVSVGAQRKTKIVVEAKRMGSPRVVRDAIYQLKHYLSQFSSENVYGVVGVPFISPESAQLCLEAGLGYLDLSGNCHFEFEGVYIHIKGNANRFKSERSLKTLFSPKATRVLRYLLSDIHRLWKVKDLQVESGVSLGLVSNIRKLLLDQEWSSKENPLQVKKPEKLLDAWKAEDDWKKRTEVREYSLLISNPNEAVSKIHRLLGDLPHAFTQWTAANLKHPFADTEIITVYVKRFPDDNSLKECLLARRVDSGGRLKVVVPQDIGVINPLQWVDGVPLVPDVQIYLDLQKAGYRGEEAAEELRHWADFSGGWQ